MKVALPSRAPRSKEWTTSVGEVASYKDMGDLLPRRRAPLILVVDDQASIAGLMSQLLTIRGYDVVTASTADQAEEEVHRRTPDLILSDVMMPGKDGHRVCRELRDGGFRAPILMLTARDSIEDRVVGLDCGADDYLIKPFDFKELLARIRALLRRPISFRPETMRVADLTLNTANHTAARSGRPISLTAKEYALLAFLIVNENRVVGRGEIAEHVWDENFDPFSNVIDVYIKRLRAKVDTGFEPPLIHTRRGEGYILTTEPANRHD